MSWRAWLEDWALKAFSLVAAVVLWLFVAAANNTPVDVDFRLELRCADDMMVVNDAARLVHATLEGPWATFFSYESNTMQPVIVDLMDAGPGVVRQVITTSQITPPNGMRAVSVRPAEVEIILDRRVERHVPIHVDTINAPAFGFEVTATQAVPQKARVVGPLTRMQSLDVLTTRPVDISGADAEMTQEVEIKPPAAPLRLVDKRATVTIDVTEEIMQRSFVDVPIQLTNAPKGAVFSPSHVTLHVRGPRRWLEPLKRDALSVAVDVADEVQKGVAHTERTVSVALGLPERSQLVAPIPKIDVTLQSHKKARR